MKLLPFILGFAAGGVGSWANSYLTEWAIKLLFSPGRSLPKWSGGLFGLFFLTKLMLLFAFCYAVIRFLNFSLLGVIAGILTYQIYRTIHLAYRYLSERDRATS